MRRVFQGVFKPVWRASLRFWTGTGWTFLLFLTRAARWCIFQPDFTNLVSFERRVLLFFNLVSWQISGLFWNRPKTGVLALNIPNFGKKYFSWQIFEKKLAPQKYVLIKMQQKLKIWGGSPPILHQKNSGVCRFISREKLVSFHDGDLAALFLASTTTKWRQIDGDRGLISW